MVVMTLPVRESIVSCVKLAAIAPLLPTFGTTALLGQLFSLSVPWTMGAKLWLLLTRGILGQEIIEAAKIWLVQSGCSGTT